VTRWHTPKASTPGPRAAPHLVVLGPGPLCVIPSHMSSSAANGPIRFWLPGSSSPARRPEARATGVLRTVPSPKKGGERERQTRSAGIRSDRVVHELGGGTKGASPGLLIVAGQAETAAGVIHDQHGVVTRCVSFVDVDVMARGTFQPVVDQHPILDRLAAESRDGSRCGVVQLAVARGQSGIVRE